MSGTQSKYPGIQGDDRNSIRTDRLGIQLIELSEIDFKITMLSIFKERKD